PVAPSLFGIAIITGLAAAVQLVLATNSVRRAATYSSDPAKRESSPAAWAFVLFVYGMAAALFWYGAVNFAAMSNFAAGHPGLTLTLACLFLWLLLMALAPLAAAMGLLGVFCTAFFIGLAPAMNASGSEVAGFLTNSQVSVLPLFLMMGSF